MCLGSLEFLHHGLQFLNVDLAIARLVVPGGKCSMKGVQCTMNDIIRGNYVNSGVG